MLPWLGGAGPDLLPRRLRRRPALIGFGVAIPVIGVFSAVIYLIAYAVALPAEKVQEYIDDVQAEAAAEEKELGATP